MIEMAGGRLTVANSLLAIVDVQEKLVGAMLETGRFIERIELLARVAQKLNIPIVTSEQYPKGLGPTIDRLKPYAVHPVEKLSFSCLGEPEWLAEVERHKRPVVIVCGIESHVCVQQTALDLLERRRQVYIAADAVSSRRTIDRDWSLQRMNQAGVCVTTTESIVFEWLGAAGTADFKAVAPWLRNL